MIISAPVNAYPSRDDKVFWAVQSANKIESPSGITRCVFVFKKDDQPDVVIDSNTVSEAFDFSASRVVRGRLVLGLEWMPSVVLDTALFSVTGTWKADVYLYDAVHVDGVFHGQFEMKVFINDVVSISAPVLTGIAILADTAYFPYLTWTESIGPLPIIEYDIYYSDDTFIDFTDATTLEYLDTSATAGSYTYYVTATDGTNTSLPSNLVTVTIPLSFTITIGGPNSSGPLLNQSGFSPTLPNGDGSGYWRITCNGISAIGSTSLTSGRINGKNLLACGWSGASSGYFVIMIGGIFPQSYLDTVSVESPANLSFTGGSANYSVDTIGQRTVWYWPDSNEGNYLGQTLTVDITFN